MSTPTLLSLPNDALSVVYRHLPLTTAIRLSRTCRALHQLFQLNFVHIASALSLAHTYITDTQLADLCSRVTGQGGAVRVLSVAGCPQLTVDGLVAAFKIIGEDLVYLDVSGCHAGLINNEGLVRMAEFLKMLRVLRLAYVPQVTDVGLFRAVARGFGRQIETLDVSYTWMMPTSLVGGLFPRLKCLVAPGTKLMSMGGLGERRRGILAGGGDRHIKTLILSVDVWEVVSDDDVELLNLLLRTIEVDGLREFRVKDAFVAAARWNKQVRKASESASRNTSWPKRNLTYSVDDHTTLLSYAALRAAVECAKVLVEECDAYSLTNDVSTAALTPLRNAILCPVDSSTKSRLIQTLLPCAGTDLSSPRLAELLSLVASRRDIVAMRALLARRSSHSQWPLSSPSPPSDRACSDQVTAALSNALLKVFDETNYAGSTFIRSSCRDTIRYLVGEGAIVSPQFKTRTTGDNALHLAARYGDADAFQELLEGIRSKEEKVRVLLDRNGAEQTALMIAASNDAEFTASTGLMVNLILITMADTQSASCGVIGKFDFDSARSMVAALLVSNDGLARLIADHRPSCIKCLIDQKASNWTTIVLHSVARRVGRGGTANEDLLYIGQKVLGARANATVSGNRGKKHEIEMSNWLNIETKDSLGRSALHYAAGASDPTFARSLLHYGAEVNAEDFDGATPLCTAVEWHASRSCLQFLIRAGAHVSKMDSRGRGPLHRAAEARNGAAAAVLLRHGGDPYCSDKLGIAPIDIDRALLHRASRFSPYSIELDQLCLESDEDVDDDSDSDTAPLDAEDELDFHWSGRRKARTKYKQKKGALL